MILKYILVCPNGINNCTHKKELAATKGIEIVMIRNIDAAGAMVSPPSVVTMKFANKKIMIKINNENPNVK